MSFDIGRLLSSNAYNYNSYSGNNLANLLQGNTAKAAPNSDQAVIVSLSKDVSLSKLEKHLDDYEKGKGYLSNQTAKGLQQLKRNNATTLSRTSPGSFSDYLAYSSALGYKQNSRFVHSINEMASNIKNLKA